MLLAPKLNPPVVPVVPPAAVLVLPKRPPLGCVVLAPPKRPPVAAGADVVVVPAPEAPPKPPPAPKPKAGLFWVAAVEVAPKPPKVLVAPAVCPGWLVAAPKRPPVAGFWPVGLRDRLPEIPIPLRAPHPDARLDLQGLLDRIYDASGYAYYIYEGAPSPALAPDDDAWARALIPTANP